MPQDLSPVIQTILTEAAGEKEEGMKRVGMVILSRSRSPRWKGMTPDQIVQQKAQFSGWERPDRAAFIAKQPPQVIAKAQQAWQRAQETLAPGGVWADHYVSNQLFESPRRPSWVGKMKVVERFGGHTFLSEP